MRGRAIGRGQVGQALARGGRGRVAARGSSATATRVGSTAVVPGSATASPGDVLDLATREDADPEVDIADVSGGLLFSDGELQGHIEGGSSEFERLMEDSFDSERPVPNLGVSAPAVALRSPRSNVTLEASPQISPLRGSSVIQADDLLMIGEPTQPLTSTERGLGVPAPLIQPQVPAMTSSQEAPNLQSRTEVFFESTDPRDTWAVRQLASRMEQVGREMRASVEHEFILALQGCNTQHRAALESEKMKAEATAIQQQALIDRLQEENQQLTKKLELKQRKLKDSLWMLSRARNGVVGKCVLERAMCAWRTKAAAEKDGRVNQVLATRLCDQHSARVAFSTWRCHAQAAVKSKLINHERAAAEVVRAKLFEQLEADRTRSSAEVDRLSRLLADEAQQRQFLQENLKSAFMRGVCALNREAMSLLSDGSSGVEASASSTPGHMLGQAPPTQSVSVAPPSPAFDWADFEAKSAGATGSICLGQEPMSNPIDAPVAQVAADELPATSSLETNSPRRPPVPASQPLPASPQPLPFVNWSCPSEPPPAMGASSASQVRSSLKSQRWQQANVPRGQGQIRPEVVAVG